MSSRATYTVRRGERRDDELGGVRVDGGWKRSRRENLAPVRGEQTTEQIKAEFWRSPSTQQQRRSSFTTAGLLFVDNE